MNQHKITIYQCPNNRGENYNAKGFTKVFSIEQGDIMALSKAVEFDSCPGFYEGGHKKGEKFIQADCILGDIDNTHSENSNDWKTHEDVKDAFPDVCFYHYPSRNNMKDKNGMSARPKEHFIFPINTVKNVEDYSEMMNWLIETFPELHFDPQVKSPAQLNFGVEGAQAFYVSGNINLSEFREKKRLEKLNEDDIIQEGSRNDTMFRYALDVLKRYGNKDDRGHKEFIKKSRSCSPPLASEELKSIWKSASGYYPSGTRSDSETNQTYEYSYESNQKLVLNVQNDDVFKDLLDIEPGKRYFSIYICRKILEAFGIIIRKNKMNQRTEVEGLPSYYSGENACNLLEALVYDITSVLRFKKATSSVIYNYLSVIAYENSYHPVIALLNRKSWDGVDRFNELYRILGISNDFHKTLVRKWALQSIAVLFNTEEKPIAAQGILVLQGGQGLGKTEFFRHLAINNKFFKGGATLDMTNKDSLMSATKVWICELGELDNTTKKEQSSLKAFLTEYFDRYREPYARFETILPRITSFCGTVNPVDYLRDETGNRRFWTVPVQKIDIKKVFEHPPEWYTQFWRQVYDEYIQNPDEFLLTKEEQDKVNERNTDFERPSHGELELMEIFDFNAPQVNWEWKTAAQIAKMLNDEYLCLRISSASVGKLFRRVLGQRQVEFQQKTINGKRFVCCPPAMNINETVSDEELLNYQINPRSRKEDNNEDSDIVDFD